jgi:hypothetical protein
MPVPHMVIALLLASLAIPAYAAVPGSIEVTCDVDRKAFRSLANAAPDVTFRLWDAETGGSQCGPDHIVPMQDLRVFKAKTDRFDGQRPRKFGEIRAVGSDAQPIELCAGAETWMDVTVSTTTLTCEFSADPNSKPGVLPDAPARRRLQAVAFAREAEHSEACETCTGVQDVSVKVFRSTDFSAPSGVFTAIPFTEERWDTVGLHNNGDPTRLTAPVDGKYLIFGSVIFDGSASTGHLRDLGIYLNGVGTGQFLVQERSQIETTDFAKLAVVTHHTLAAGDFVELAAYQDTGALLVLFGAALGSMEFGMVKLP